MIDRIDDIVLIPARLAEPQSKRPVAIDHPQDGLLAGPGLPPRCWTEAPAESASDRQSGIIHAALTGSWDTLARRRGRSDVEGI